MASSNYRLPVRSKALPNECPGEQLTDGLEAAAVLRVLERASFVTTLLRIRVRWTHLRRNSHPFWA